MHQYMLYGTKACTLIVKLLQHVVMEHACQECTTEPHMHADVPPAPAADYYATAAQGLPHAHDLHAWDNLCFGQRSATAAAAGDESEQLTSLSGHVLDTIMALEQVGVGAGCC